MPNSTVEDVLVFRWTPEVVPARRRPRPWRGLGQHRRGHSVGSASRAQRGARALRCASVRQAKSTSAAPTGRRRRCSSRSAGAPRRLRRSERRPARMRYCGRCARAVAATGEASAEKLLADELEVVHAVRDLIAYQPVNVRETARHIATVAARALSCDVAAVRVRRQRGNARHHSVRQR